MFADFRIANSQGTAVFRLPTEKFTTTLSKIRSSCTRQSPASTIIDCREFAYRAREEHRLPDGTSPALSRAVQTSRLAARVNENVLDLHELTFLAVALRKG